MEKIKNIVIVALFTLILVAFPLYLLLSPDQTLSLSERRALAQKPTLNADTAFNGKFMTGLDSYLQDQFPLREQLRTVNALVNRYVQGRLEHHDYYYANGHLSKMEYGLSKKEISKAAQKLNALAAEHMQGLTVYYSIIPDKNYVLAPQNGYLSLDYEALAAQLAREVEGMEYIDIYDTLSLNDYYRTDSHWRQENLYPVAQRLANGMGATLAPEEAFARQELGDFYGVYVGQAALPVAPDKLFYLTSSYTQSATVVSAELGDTQLPVYNLDKFNDKDSYDVFLSGAQALMVIECDTPVERELILFRDSYGSSLAPLLLGAYSKITLVDLRYMSSALLAEMVDFTGDIPTDVLFLYSASLLNRSSLLR